MPVTVVQFKDRRDLVAVAALGHPREEIALATIYEGLRTPRHP